jgi:beta-glucosidase
VNNDNTFPENFVWGVAAAATQIEGAAWSEGKGPSVWDVFARQPGNVAGGDTPDVACDHYHRFEEDFALMADLGVRHYRLSIAWPRIHPQGRGAPNPRGLDFYHRLIDAALARGITPWVTMFHWDLPQALEDEGGWRVRGVTAAFEAYARTIVRAYGDRVKRWITLNEILCFTRLGYGDGSKAPGRRDGERVVNQTFHHALVCHGLGVRAVRELGGPGAEVGLADNAFIPVPVTETPRDIEAARQIFVRENARVLDPIHRGRYAPAYLAQAGADAPVVEPGDFELIAAPTDFLGLNIYTGTYVRAGTRGEPESLTVPADFPAASGSWQNLLPRALYWGPRLAEEIYGVKKIHIVENGAGYRDRPTGAGEIQDLHRLEYVRSCLGEMGRAIRAGVPIRGYFLWSFMDNFEWQDGYTQRFGIVHVDFATQRRTPKLSAGWYREVMRQNRLV